MSIIDKHRLSRQQSVVMDYDKDNLPREAQKILNQSTLINLAEKTLEKHKVDSSEMLGYRRRTMVHEWKLKNILDAVTKPSFVFSIDSMVKHFIESVALSQGNGNWKLIDFQILVEKKEIVKHKTGQKKDYLTSDEGDLYDSEAYVQELEMFLIGLEIVDTKNAPDVEYEMGQPTGTKKGGLDNDLLSKIITAQGLQVNPEYEKKQQEIQDRNEALAAQNKALEDQNKVMQDQMNQFAKQQAEMQLMMANLLKLQETSLTSSSDEEQSEPKPSSKKKSK